MDEHQSNDASAYAGKTRDVYYRVRSLGKIGVQAKDAETGEPVPDTDWDLYTESGFWKYWEWNDDYSGISFYTYHDDIATITAEKPSDPLKNYLGYQTAETTVTSERWETKQVDLLMQRDSYGTVSGRILDSSGNDVAGATVELLWPNEFYGEYFMAGYYGKGGYDSGYYTTLKTVQTDEEGRYTFNNVIPAPEDEKYAVRASIENKSTGVSNGFNLASGEDVYIGDLIMGLAPDIPVWGSSAGINAVSVGWGGVILEWPAAYVADDYNYYIDGYRVFQGGDLVADISAAYYADMPVIRCRVDNLEPDTMYNFSVQAYSNTGMGSGLLVMEEPVTTHPEYDPDVKVIRASVSSEGLEGIFLMISQYEDAMPESYWPAMSADGRFIAFTSNADSLYSRDFNRSEDVFVFDRQTGTLECISLSYDGSGETGNSYSFNPSISSDGRYVVFFSYANNLVPGVDFNYSADVYIYDREKKSMELVSAGKDGKAEGNASTGPRLSGDGRYVVYSGWASDRNEYVFIWDRDTKETVRLDYPVVAERVVQGAFSPVISTDGNYIAYSAEFSVEHSDYYIYLHNRQDGTTELVSRKYDNPDEPVSGFIPSISADGRYIAFASAEDTLVANDTNGSFDVFVYDRILGETKIASLAYDGSQGNGHSDFPAISANGRFVVFSSEASNLVPGDNNSGIDVFVRDLVMGTTERISVTAAGSEADELTEYSWYSRAAVNANGHYVAYESVFCLVPDDTNEAVDIYVYDRGPQEDPSVPTYTVTVTNGTGSGEYEEGEAVSISAHSAPDGYRFKEWQVISGGVTLEDPEAPDTSFIMPANDVEIAAVYEEIPVATYTVTVNGSYAAANGAGSYKHGDTVTIDAGSRENYSFSGWTSPDGVAFANPDSVITTFTMPAKDVTVTANWTSTFIPGEGDDEDEGGDEERNEEENEDENEDGNESADEEEGNGGTGNSGSGQTEGSSTPSTPVITPSPTYNANIRTEQGTAMTVQVRVDKNVGMASVDIDSDKLAQGKASITIPPIPDVESYSVSVPVRNLSTDHVQDAFTFNTEAGSITVPSNMLTGVTVPEGDKVQITIGRGDKSVLPEDVWDAIGDRPLAQLTLTVDGSRIEWNNPNAPVTVTIPYTPTAEELENPESIVVWYIDGSGNVVCVTNGRYDPATGSVTFTTTHFSYYAVGYKKVSFSDVAKDAWYAKAVSFIAARDITQGTGNGSFSPEAKLTRAQFIVMMMKAYGIAPDETPADNFADAGDTWYTGYLAAAKRLGISAGVGNNMFAPDMDITRQEMFTLLYNALKAIEQLPEGDSGKTLSDYSDADDIASWAKDAMKLLVETGIVSGSGNSLSPKDTTTRAQMAQLLYNLLNRTT